MKARRKRLTLRRKSTKKRVRQEKPINWGKVLKAAKAKEDREDAARAVALIEELHYIVCVKHGTKKRSAPN